MKMRNVSSHLLEDKMDEAVTHYINTQSQPVHLDTHGLSLNIQEEGGSRVVTLMHPQSFSPQMCRQVTVGEHVGDGPWSEDLPEDPESRIAALAAHLAQHTRLHHQHLPHHKVIPARSEMESSVMLERLGFNGQALEQPGESIVVQVSSLPPLPPLQEMKRCQETDWFHSKNKTALKDDAVILNDDTRPSLELPGSPHPSHPSPHHKQHNKKSLPHKKRISRRMRRNNGGSTPQQEIVVVSCQEDVAQEEILPDNLVAAVQHNLPDHHHIATEVRAMFICQLCGEYYGEQQLKFYQHLKQHYEPHDTIIIENPVPDLAIDKMTNTCIVDNVATLPDSIVELSLESTMPKTTIYQPIDKHILYTTSDKTLSFSSNKVLYSMANMDKEPNVDSNQVEKEELYETLEKVELYSCTRCNKSFRKQRHCEQHIKEVHSNNRLEEMNEFSEPEDLMEGIHVTVDEGGEHYEHTLLPHLTVENGHVHHDQSIMYRYTSSRLGGGHHSTLNCGSEGACPMCPASTRMTHEPQQLKEEVFHRIFEGEIDAVNGGSRHFAGSETEISHEIIHESEVSHEQEEPPDHAETQETTDKVPDYGGKLEYEQTDKVPEYGGKLEYEQTDKVPEYGDKLEFEQADKMKYGGEKVVYEDKEMEFEDKADYEEEVSTQKGPKAHKTFSCPHCERVFIHRNSLLYHVLSHKGKRPHECTECGKGFYTAGALKVHNRVHNGDKPYKCDECGRDFRQWGDLKYHVVSIHTDMKHYKCEFCGKEFSRKYSLSVHRRIHTGEKNYKCEYCTKTFRASSYRLTHMRTHTGDKPHKCEQCEKCFRVSADLRRHMLTHEKHRLRLEDAKNKEKHKDKDDKKSPLKSELKLNETVKIEIFDETKDKMDIETSPKAGQGNKKIAVASTTRLPIPKNLSPIQKKPAQSKSRKGSNKKGAPNVTINSRANTEQSMFKNSEFANNVEVFDTRQMNSQYSKFKEVFIEPTTASEPNVNNQFNKIKQTNYPSDQNGTEQKLTDVRDFATLKPMFRPNQPCEIPEGHKIVYVNRNENTDGKMTVFTHVEKGKEYIVPIVANSQTNMDDSRPNIEIREGRTELNGDSIENGFFERLQAFYNIPAV